MAKVSRKQRGAPRVAMLLSNPLAPDPRVSKEAKALADVGFEVTVYAWDRECCHAREEQTDGFRIVRVYEPATYGQAVKQIRPLLRYGRQVRKLLQAERPTVIHCHDLETLPLGYRIGRSLGATVVFDAHEWCYYGDAQRLRWLLVGAGRALERYYSPRCDLIVVTNQYQVEKYRRLGAKKIVQVPNFPILQQVSPRSSRRASGLVVGRIGAVYRDFGVEESVHAIAALRAKGYDVSLVVSGKTTPDYAAELERLARQYPDAFTYTGPYSPEQLGSLYERVDLTLTAWTKRCYMMRHNTPTKFYESLMFAVPVFSTDVGGVGEMISACRCGLLLDDATPSTIERALTWAYDHKDELEAMGLRGRKAIERQWNWSVSAKRLTEAYCELCQV